MSNTRRCVGFLIVVGGVASALANDPRGPTYFVRDGKLIPTVIVPPTAAGSGAADVSSDGAARHAAQNAREQQGVTTSQPPDEPRVVVRGPRYPRSRQGDSPVSLIQRYRSDGSYYGYNAYDSAYQQRALEDAYFSGRLDEREDVARRFNEQDMNRRAERVLSAHDRALQLGLQRLKEGDYSRAIVALAMAADLDNGDPACRIHLAQARVAQGHYDEAAQTLRRALELQPKLAYVELNLAAYLPNGGAYDQHVDALGGAVRERRASVDVHFLLGYLEFQRGRYEDAYGAFRRVAEKMPKDELTQTYLTITKPAAGAQLTKKKD